MTIEVEIPQKYHGTIMGAKGFRIQEITREHNVNIKLPERRNEERSETFDCSKKITNERNKFILIRR